MEQLSDILKSLRQIKPNSEYKKLSLERILASSQIRHPLAGFKFRIFESIRFSAALALAGILLVAAVSILSYFNGQSAVHLTTPDSAEFRIRLGEAKYFDDIIKEIAEYNKEIEKLLEEITL